MFFLGGFGDGIWFGECASPSLAQTSHNNTNLGSHRSLSHILPYGADNAANSLCLTARNDCILRLKNKREARQQHIMADSPPVCMALSRLCLIVMRHRHRHMRMLFYHLHLGAAVELMLLLAARHAVGTSVEQACLAVAHRDDARRFHTMLHEVCLNRVGASL